MSGDRRVSLALVLATTLLTLAIGYLIKTPCLVRPGDGREYRLLCYSDVTALYRSSDRHRGLTEDLVPYVEGENEYPVLSGLAMWAAAVPARSYVSYFNWTAVLLTAFALATAWALHRMAGGRALMFALAPTLAIYGFVNWDLVAVALATLATLAYLRRRDGTSGVLLGLGAAAKLYPALLAAPFAIGRARRGRRRLGIRIAVAAAAAWAAVNVPFAVASPGRWSEFYRFNTERGADWDSVWFMLQRHLGFVWDPAALNVVSTVAFALAVVVLWGAAGRRRPSWQLGFPLLVAFLLTSKVYSPQYGLWLLPWFALTLPDLRLFALFEVADAAVFVTRFEFFARYLGVGDGVPFWAFEVAVLARAAVLVACLVWWVRRGTAPGPISTEPALQEAPA